MFDVPADDLGPAQAVLACLNEHAMSQRSRQELQSHLDVLRARIGGESLLSRAQAKGVDPQALRMTVPYVREFGLCTFDFGGAVLSVDIFNAANELNLGEECGRNVVEVFRVDGRDVRPLVDMGKEVFDAAEATSLFGGVGFYVTMFLQLYEDARQGRRKKILPWDLLWPLTGIQIRTPEEPLGNLSVYRVLSGKRGAVIQVFEDLWTGNHEKYSEAARALGLQSFWSL